ncbi:hypothetical protein LSUE1_G008674 [Lachnellula suecica]|uniref:G domain-containing protein n=1 Tax=Lachnellula suecica TaxID=602035 RepID=A0A8T9BYS1_9HELO|nr:hypothetical protein LSUE1_G008674 [Lachnellula suecica]
MSGRSLMGATGAGKSTFINTSCGSSKMKVGRGLRSCTKDLGGTTFDLDDGEVTLVDTPGFNDDKLTDTEVLVMIANFLEVTYAEGIKLAGIVYMYDISGERMGGTGEQNLSMFEQLCGTDFKTNVAIVTNRWDKMEGDEELAEERITQLQEEYWADWLENGTKLFRHDGTPYSAHKIIRHLAKLPVKGTKLQKQLVEQDIPLMDTAAGEKVSREATELRKKLEAQFAVTLEKSETDISGKYDKRLKDLQERLDDNMKDFKRLESREKEVESLKSELKVLKDTKVRTHMWRRTKGFFGFD